MKVGTDGVLLGAWTNINNANSILDIGTGTGLIALMLAQRSKANIIAVEIDSDAAKQAHENFIQSKYANQITLINKSIQQYKKTTKNKFDLIVSNPPYFSNALKSPKQNRTTARHTNQLSYYDLIKISKNLLHNNGRLSLIIPIDRENEIDNMCFDNNLFCIRKTCIKPTPDKQSIRVLLEFSPQKKQSNISEIIIENNGRHQYSKEYINLTKDFYLYL